jgi:hypothetical protein
MIKRFMDISVKTFKHDSSKSDLRIIELSDIIFYKQGGYHVKQKMNGLSKITLINLLMIILVHAVFVTLSLLAILDMNSGENHPFAILIALAIFLIVLASSGVIIIFSIPLTWFRYRFSSKPNIPKSRLDALNVAQLIFAYIGLILSFSMLIILMRITNISLILTLYVLSMILFLTLIFATLQHNKRLKNMI